MSHSEQQQNPQPPAQAAAACQVDHFASGPDTSAPLGWYYHKAREYWFEDRSSTGKELNRWFQCTGERMVRRHLGIHCGLREQKDKENNEPYSPADMALHDIEFKHRLCYAGMLAGWKRGIHYHENGQPFLVTDQLNLMEPAPGDFPMLLGIFEGMFGKEQLVYFFGWLQHFLKSLYITCKPSQSKALVLVGGVESGKTLCYSILKQILNVEEADPYAWMTGQDNFNSELFRTPLLVVDEGADHTDYKSRKHFGTFIKKICVKPTNRARGMHADAETLRPIWRLIICLNPDNLLVLPPLESDVQDKMIVCKVEKHPMPMPTHTDAEQAAFFDCLKLEMPSLVHYLLYEFELPAELRARRGYVKEYWNKEIENELYGQDPAIRLYGIIEQVIFPPVDDSFAAVNKWEGNADMLKDKLYNGAKEYDKKWIGKQHPYAGIGKYLSALQKKYPGRFRKDHVKKGNFWTLYREGCEPEGPEGFEAEAPAQE